MSVVHDLVPWGRERSAEHQRRRIVEALQRVDQEQQAAHDDRQEGRRPDNHGRDEEDGSGGYVMPEPSLGIASDHAAMAIRASSSLARRRGFKLPDASRVQVTR